MRDESAIDDVLQEIRRRLLVGRSPKIASYRGFGTLQSWLCAIAVNTAKDHVRADRARRSRALAATHCQLLTLGEVPPQAGAGESSPNGRLTAECVHAVRLAFRSLELKDRRLLQEHFISGLSIDKLVPSYLVNRATIARRIQRTTGRIRERVRRQLASRFRGETAEALDAIAFSTCRDHLLDVAGLLGPRAAQGRCIQCHILRARAGSGERDHAPGARSLRRGLLSTWRLAELAEDASNSSHWRCRGCLGEWAGELANFG